MTFGKAVPKGEGARVEEYSPPLTDKELLKQAQEYIKSMRKQINNLEGDAMRYRRLRQLEVVIMAEDGAKYLRKGELDVYIDELPARNTFTRSELLKELTPALNKVFGEEYEKYAAEHADKLAEHFDREAVLNVKT